ncbi:PREDICTED: stimulated by retinoic acid gene 6 protein homolog isoform X2 [Acropora digitifera]|uniref:stimulated by retinoic acid gene 6 protein homolog isoform X2 n=1 Tax=Acropora digitifera TaxID=70779 RepID=UPI00077A3E4F|nr:PREDICTED: stimulated by retinoic acid gene 6 protein homolog isoform X2 [Acropora digitifera]
MASPSVNSYENLTASSCTLVDQKLFNLGCLGPSLAIILILSFLKRRESFMLSSCNGYPGLVIPINFLRSFKSNRFAIAATFGATASACLDLLWKVNQFFPPDSSHVWKVIQGLLSVLIYGILFYPFFACLTTKYKLIGSLMGFVYAAIRFPFALVFFFQCGSDDENLKKLQYLQVLAALPRLCCLLFILLRFAVLLSIQVREQWFSGSSDGTCLHRVTDSDPDVDSLLIGNTDIEHVRRLLNLEHNKTPPHVKGFMKLLHCIYQPRPDFKFSPQFVSTLIVTGIMLFQIAVNYFILSDWMRKYVPSLCGRDKDPKSCENPVNTVIGFVDGAWVLCLLISILLLLHFMKCHRDHVFQLYRGERELHQDVFVSPRGLVGKSLRFSGYQIAHSILGFLCLLFPIVVIALITGFFNAFSYDPRVQQVLKFLQQAAVGFLPTLVISVLLWLFQLFLTFFVFCDRDFPNITISVGNRQLFSIASYFFFFYNILLGIFAGLIRILKAVLLGVLFMARIDRPFLMHGYHTWDKAFVAYLGFLNVLVAHSHPVMLVFCYLLINRNSDSGIEELLPQIKSFGVPREQSYGEEATGVHKRTNKELGSDRVRERLLLTMG